MISFVTVIHVTVCVFLMIAILMQSGRGGGLTEAFASAESMFGAKTNVFMVRVTSILAGIFLVTCLTLAYFSAVKDQSLMPNTVMSSNPAATPGAPVSPAPAAPSNDATTTQP